MPSASACEFDGVNRLIIVNTDVSSIDVKIDIYSDWKEWVLEGDNSKFLEAIRTIGGDPIGGGKYAGDIYFLMNDWKVYVDHSVAVDGVLFSDDGSSPYVTSLSTFLVTNTVSNLVQTVSTAGGSGATAAEVWAYVIDGKQAKNILSTTEKKVDDNQALIISM